MRDGAMSRLLARARGDRWVPEAPAEPPPKPGGPTWPQEIEFYDFG
jgi:hypothetical protein